MRLITAIAIPIASVAVAALALGCSSSRSSPAAQAAEQPTAVQAQTEGPSDKQASSSRTTAPDNPPDSQGAGADALESPDETAGPQDHSGQDAEGTARGSSFSRGAAGAGDSRGEDAAKPSGASQTGGGARTDSERTAGLDRELDRSMEEFDGLLLEEQVRIAEAAAAGAAGSVPARGDAVASGGGGGASAEASAGSRQGGGTGGSPDAPSGKPGDRQPGAAGATSSRSGDERPPVPDDVGDGSDDDVIARQLREAAMNEKDPELREKLWQEYRDYKASLGGKTGDGDE